MERQSALEIFLSHCSADKPAVLKLANALRTRGYEVRLDAWDMVSERPSPTSPRVTMVCMGPSGLGPWEESEMRVFLSKWIERGMPLFPVILPAAPGKPEWPSFLGNYRWFDLRPALSEEGLDRLTREILETPSLYRSVGRVSEAFPLTWDAWYETAGPGPYPYEESPREGNLPGMTEYLVSHLGAAVTAYLSGLTDARSVALCASNDLAPGPLVRSRLALAYEAARLVVNAYDDETAQSWFFGMNPHLDDEAPAYVLRHGHVPEDWQFVVPAAHELVGNAF